MTAHIAAAGSVDWATPVWIIDDIKKMWGRIGLDPCSNAHSAVGAEVEFRLPETNGLLPDWGLRHDHIYVNPPYGRTFLDARTNTAMSAKQYREALKLNPDLKNCGRSSTIQTWIQKCFNAHKFHGRSVMALIPAAVDTQHWHRYIFGHTSVCFFRGRVRFDLPPDASPEDQKKNAPPMGTALIYWGAEVNKFRQIFGTRGYVCDIGARW